MKKGTALAGVGALALGFWLAGQAAHDVKGKVQNINSDLQQQYEASGGAARSAPALTQKTMQDCMVHPDNKICKELGL